MTGFVIRGASTLSVLAIVVGCSKDPAKDKPAADVAEAAQSSSVGATEPAPEAGKETLKLAADSRITFVGSKVTGSHEGTFDKVDGTIALNGDDPEQANVKVVIDMDSVKSEPEKFVKHLRTDDFFAIKKFPNATFVTTSIKKGGEGGASHTVTGNLEMRGVTKSVTFPATITIRKDQVSAKAEFSINRKDWGIEYKGMPDDLIRDDVVVRLDLKAKRG